MSLFHSRTIKFLGAEQLLPRRTGGVVGPGSMTADTAMRNSAAWACLRLRANLLSSFPVDAYRRFEGIQVEVPKPPVLVAPGGPGQLGKVRTWLYSSQVDLDRYGNCFGLITEKDGNGLPSRVDLQPAGETTVRVKDGEIEYYRIRAKRYEPDEVWHERQYTVAGLQVGLSPIAYAAWTLGQYASIQEFALDWFGNGTIPSAVLKNNRKQLNAEETAEVKRRYKAAQRSGDVFVTGADWDYSLIKAEVAASQWLEAQNAGVVDVARFLDCPSDLIDAAVSGQSITYANLTQRNLQLLITGLGPAVARREDALSDWLARPRYVKLNTDSLLRMDPETRAKVLGQQVKDRLRAPSEARELDDLAPFTPEQLEEFAVLFGKPQESPKTSTSGGTS